MMDLSPELSQFINEAKWTFAKTYAETWPHEYIVQEQVPQEMFIRLAKHIDFYGQKEPFYQKRMTYFYHNNHVYWHMENIINRCRPEETYSRRLEEGRLPTDECRE